MSIDGLRPQCCGFHKQGGHGNAECRPGDPELVDIGKPLTCCRLHAAGGSTASACNSDVSFRGPEQALATLPGRYGDIKFKGPDGPRERPPGPLSAVGTPSAMTLIPHVELADDILLLLPGPGGAVTLSPEGVEALRRMAEDYRRLKGLTVAGQRRPVVLYHGSWRRHGEERKGGGYGIHLYTRSGRALDEADERKLKVPKFSRGLDGGYCPGRDDRDGYWPGVDMQPQSMVRTTHEAGWTLFGFWDRTGTDQRGGLNSTFLVEGTWEFGDLDAIIADAFPMLHGRFGRLYAETPDAWRLCSLGAIEEP